MTKLVRENSFPLSVWETAMYLVDSALGTIEVGIDRLQLLGLVSFMIALKVGFAS